MPRILFEKNGNAVWISHLDLMRLFQRAFKRAGFPLTHTQGFNPRPSVSVALPLSVGVDSCCELLDFDLECELPEKQDFITRLNAALVAGVKVLDVYSDGKKIRDLSYLQCDVFLEYENGMPEKTENIIMELLNRSEVNVEKKNRNGVTVQNITTMILDKSMEKISATELVLHCTVCCQNPTLNPAQIINAIEKYCPDYSPSFYHCSRLEILDKDKNVFR